MFLGWPLFSGLIAVLFVVLFAVGVLRKPKGTPLMVRADGEDEGEAVKAIVDLFASKFGEGR